jgi:hypothetical protein
VKVSSLYPGVYVFVAINLGFQFLWIRPQLVALLFASPDSFSVHVGAILPLLTSEELVKLATMTDYLGKCIRSVPIILSLQLIQKCPDNDRILAFAFCSLDRYSTETIFFYIPQIVQLLRKDHHGNFGCRPTVAFHVF